MTMISEVAILQVRICMRVPYFSIIIALVLLVGASSLESCVCIVFSETFLLWSFSVIIIIHVQPAFIACGSR